MNIVFYVELWIWIYIYFFSYWLFVDRGLFIFLIATLITKIIYNAMDK